MNTARVLIVIVNYGTPALTLDCVESLRATLEHFPNTELTLVDNGSGDDSLKQFHAAEIIQTLRARIHILSLPQNIGYAAGNNAAIRLALQSPSPPDYIWLLNSDTQVRAHALDALLETMENQARAGIAGSRLENADGTPQRSAFRFPSIPGEWEANVHWAIMTRLCARWVLAPPVPDTAARTDWVPGASMLLRRVMLDESGLFDENFFMYYEDVDLCRRAQNAHWETWYVPASRVEHIVGGTSGVTSAPRSQAKTPRYWFDARRYYFLKHHGETYTVAANIAWVIGFGIYRIKQKFTGKPDTDARNMWRDFFAFNLLGQRAKA